MVRDFKAMLIQTIWFLSLCHTSVVPKIDELVVPLHSKEILPINVLLCYRLN